MKKEKTINVASYDDDSIRVITDDIDRLREKFEMYIGYTGTMAFLHLIKEVLQNSIDEAVSDISPCDEIFIYYYVKKKEIRIVDNGRGIPLSKIVAVCSYIQSSGKFNKGDNNAYKFSAGLNGVGLTAANALSKSLKVVVTRDGKRKEVSFEYGRVVNEKEENFKSDTTSTDITFIPDEKILGPVDLDYHALLDLAEAMSHLSRTKIHVHIHAPGKDGDINKTFKSNGIVDALVNMVGKSNLLMEPLYFRKEDADKNIEVAMCYVSNTTQEQVLSYANYCTTVDHGTPLTGVKAGLSLAMGSYVKDNILNKKEKETLDITGDDCRSGWACVINVNHIKPSFVGQVK